MKKMGDHKRRRKEFEKKVNVEMYKKQGRTKWTFYTSDVSKPHKVMSNKDRRALGIEEDPDLNE